MRVTSAVVARALVASTAAPAAAEWFRELVGMPLPRLPLLRKLWGNHVPPSFTRQATLPELGERLKHIVDKDVLDAGWT